MDQVNQDRYSRPDMDEGSASSGAPDPTFGGSDVRYLPDSPQMSNRKYGGNRGVITTRPSRDSVVRSYSEQAAARARNARMESQKTYHDYQVNSSIQRARWQRREELRAQSAQSASEDTTQSQIGSHAGERGSSPRVIQRQHMGRVTPPMSSEESRARYRRSQEAYERERSSRDVLSQNRVMRSMNRQVIDARGSVDSRAFNENDELVGYSIDDRDRPQPFVDSSNSKSRWRSHAGQGFDGTRSRSAAPTRPSAKRQRLNLSSLSDTISGKDSYGNPKSGIAGLPIFVKIAVPIIVVLLIVLLVILFG
ncbi:MAG: hypothetical protein HFJ64_01825 [Eggerthellaceae bacterium]|nr:hypothetical protein [Eggerthellaceae bacterium]